MTISSLPSFTEVNLALEKTKDHHHASQVHGLLCGIICATSGKPDGNWNELLFGNKKNPQITTLLEQLYEGSYHLMSEFSFEFLLLLPGDDTEIGVRTEALGLWCQGFLAGLNPVRAQLEAQENEEIMDTLNDLTEIAQVNFDNLTSNEEDETAYFELTEYVRLSALMIFHDLRLGDKEDLDDNTNTLH